MSRRIESRPIGKTVEHYGRIALATVAIGSFGIREGASRVRDYLEYKEKPEIARLYTAARYMGATVDALEDNAPQRDSSGHLGVEENSDPNSALRAIAKTREALFGLYIPELPQLTADVSAVETSVVNARSGEYHAAKTQAVATEAEAWNIMSDHKDQFNNQPEIKAMNTVIDESKYTGFGAVILYGIARAFSFFRRNPQPADEVKPTERNIEEGFPFS